jgi:hypothetical protein
MSNEDIEERAERKDPIVERIFEGISEMRGVWGKDITFSEAIRLHQYPISGYDPQKERSARLAIIDASGKDILSSILYAQPKKSLRYLCSQYLLKLKNFLFK